MMHAGTLAALGTTTELKSAFATRPIVEVRAADPVAAMSRLDELPWVERTSLFGTAVHAVLSDAGRTSADLGAALAEVGVTATDIGPVAPSLEDVFLDVVDRVERSRAA
jgi:ABC-2 type transport system ATP-binding protein